MKSLSAVLTLILTIFLQTASGQYLTDFGDTKLTPIIVSGSVTQSSTGITWSPSVLLGDSFGGNFTATYDWSTISTSLGVVLSITGPNPNLAFDVELFEPDFTSIVKYQQDTVGVTTNTTVPLNNIIESGSLNFANVGAIQFTWAGFDAIDCTITDIVAIPEPSTFALLALGSGAFLIMRKRRKVS